MAKHLKINIKNTQIAAALKGLKTKLDKKKEEPESEAEKAHKAATSPSPRPTKAKTPKEEPEEAAPKEESTPRRARSKSVFAETPPTTQEKAPVAKEEVAETPRKAPPPRMSASEEARRKVFGEDVESLGTTTPEPPKVLEESTTPSPISQTPPKTEPTPSEIRKPIAEERSSNKLGPTGRHIKDLLPPPKRPSTMPEQRELPHARGRAPAPGHVIEGPKEEEGEGATARKGPKVPVKEFRDLKPARRQETRAFDGRDRQGLRDAEEDQRWRKKRMPKARAQEEIAVVRPTSLKIRVPISIKDLAAEMKLKAAQLIAKLFLQGVIVTLNDLLDDETTIQLLGQEFGCNITIDTSEEERIRITDKTVKEEIRGSNSDELQLRPPVVAFMGHVDHGKTSLIDAIRKSNRVASEAGAITQHIGAFRCRTAVGDITILDTPGHEAFSAMRARGADVTDIVVLVVAGDEGMRQQTLEAMQHAKDANVTIVVAINKSDKPAYNAENVYRQLADQNLLPEVWGGQTLTVNCSAMTGDGISQLLETLALQAEILELKANPNSRARGTVIETEMHKGMGAVTTVLVQNGTLKLGDALVFEQYWGRVKTMRDEFGRDLAEAPPSSPVAITGLSGLPEAGQEFIVVKSERDAREIAEARMLGVRQTALQQRKKITAESLLEDAAPATKKVLNVILRADVQGSLEALKVALQKIESTKAEVDIIFAGVGEITESDIQLASTSKAVIVGFHTKVESHAEALMKQYNVTVRLHDIIYHAIDDVKVLLRNILDKLAQQTDKGKALVKALFKSSQTGKIAGCQVTDGTIQRQNQVRVIRNGEVIGNSPISSLRRVKDDVREVTKGMECGIVLTQFTDLQEGDILEAYEVTYIMQDL